MPATRAAIAAEVGGAARACRRAGGAGHADGRECQSRRGGAAVAVREGPRPARVLADVLRRRRRAACDASRRRDGHPRGDLPARARHAVGLWHPLQRPGAGHRALACVCPRVPASLPAIAALVDELRAEADARLARDAVPAGGAQIELAADMRYEGQAFELLVPGARRRDGPCLRCWSPFPRHPSPALLAMPIPGAGGDRLAARIAIGRLPKPDAADATPAARPALKGSRRVFEDGAWREVAVWDREAMPPEDRIGGPALSSRRHIRPIARPRLDRHARRRRPPDRRGPR